MVVSRVHGFMCSGHIRCMWLYDSSTHEWVQVFIEVFRFAIERFIYCNMGESRVRSGESWVFAAVRGNTLFSALHSCARHWKHAHGVHVDAMSIHVWVTSASSVGSKVAQNGSPMRRLTWILLALTVMTVECSQYPHDTTYRCLDSTYRCYSTTFRCRGTWQHVWVAKGPHRWTLDYHIQSTWDKTPWLRQVSAKYSLSCASVWSWLEISTISVKSDVY